MARPGRGPGHGGPARPSKHTEGCQCSRCTGFLPGERNINYRTGFWTREAIAARRAERAAKLAGWTTAEPTPKDALRSGIARAPFSPPPSPPPSPAPPSPVPSPHTGAQTVSERAWVSSRHRRRATLSAGLDREVF